MITGTLLLWALVFGAIGVGLFALVLWVRSHKIVTKWYDWLMGGIGLLLLLFTIQNFYTSFKEIEPTAAWMWLLVTGLPSLLLIGVPVQLVLHRHRFSGA